MHFKDSPDEAGVPSYHKIPDRTCDNCHTAKATRWFGETSALCCNDVGCYAAMQRAYDAGLQELIDQENENW